MKTELVPHLAHAASFVFTDAILSPLRTTTEINISEVNYAVRWGRIICFVSFLQFFFFFLHFKLNMALSMSSFFFFYSF